MDLLQDISNRPQTTKTFQRRQRKAEPAVASDDSSKSLDSPGSSHASSTPASVADWTSSSYSASSTALQRRGRRSSILHAAALPGGQQYQEAPASRSLLLQHMSRAKRKAYLAYTKQMADYFAEVDEFELLEESPGLPTEKKTRPRAPDSAAEPFAHTSTPIDAAAAVAAAVAGQQANASFAEPSCESPLSTRRRSRLAATPASAANVDADACQQQSPVQPPAAVHRADAQQQEEVPEEDDNGWVLLADTPAAAAAAAPSTTTGRVAAAAAAAEPHASLPVGLPSLAALAAATPGSSLQPAGSTGGCSSRLSRFAAKSGAAAAAAAPPPEHAAADELDLLASPGTLLPDVQEPAPSAEASSSVAAAAGAGVADLQQQLQGLQLAQQPADASLVSATPLLPAEPAGKARGKQGKSGPKKQPQKQQAAQQEEQQVLAEQEQQQEAVELMAQQWAQEAAGEQLAQLQAATAAAMALSPLQRMLQACGQSTNLEDIPSMQDFMADVADMRQVVKLGEGTYGEAFRAGQVVFKLVPMEGSNLINGWPQKTAGDLLGEAVIASALTGLADERDAAGNLFFSHTKAFVRTHKVGVCRGPYPASFIRAWKAWDKRNTSENDAIEGLPPQQLYACFAMSNCGKDLEGHQLRDFAQARAMMLQVALALAVAEEALAFEHRDLHWGNVMLSPATSMYTSCRLTGCSIRVRTEGAAVCLIDFTASRLQTPAGDVAFCDLELEEGLFDGPKGKCQFDTYRRMRKVTGGDWSGSHPATNVCWMIYLAELLLSEKPVPGMTASHKRALREFKKRANGYTRCGELIWDELFQGLWSVVSDAA